MSKVHVATHEFGLRFSETVLHELDSRYSRAEVDVAASGAPLAFGTVLARGADGAFAPLAAPAAAAQTEGDPEGQPAPQAASGRKVVLIQDLPAGETKALVVAGYCIVNGARLVLPEGADKKAVFAELEDCGFVVRDIPAEPWEEK